MSIVINIEGIIASGKTTLLKNIVSHYDIQPIYEPVKDNPFLDKFYRDPKRYAFTMQMWLLAKRHAANSAAFWLSKAGVNVIVDRGRLGDRCFARVNHRLGNIDDDEMAVYDEFFEAMDARDPDVMVLLDVDAEESLKRINGRGRECEIGITAEYLNMLLNEHEDMCRAAKTRGVTVLYNPSVADISSICSLKKLASN